VAKPEFLEWKGSHRGVIWHPEARFLVTTMQEPALHGWKLPEGTHMRMSGYPSRVRSMEFTAGGRFLVTSGSTEAILWPFASKDGPMGKPPTHPKDEVVVVGYEDGLALMVRIADAAEILIRAPGGGAVTALAWRPDGGAVAIGTEDGKGGMLVL
jgi:WD40 repeat protein